MRAFEALRAPASSIEATQADVVNPTHIEEFTGDAVRLEELRRSRDTGGQ